MTSHRLEHFRDLVWVLVQRDLKLRYKRSVLGILWTLVNPLVQLLVFQFVFGQFFQIGIPDFPVFLFVGIVAWNWFSGSLIQVTRVFVDNRALLARPGFPAGVLPFVTISSQLIHFLFTIPVLFVIMWLYDVHLEPTALLGLPLVIVLQAVITVGIGYGAASLFVSFRDTQYLLGLGLMIWFYLTPIFYSTDMVPEQARAIYELNPMVHLIGAYRSIFLFGTSPPLEGLVYLLACSGLILTVGYSLFRRMRADFLRQM